MNQLVLSTHIYDSGPSEATVRETDGSVLSSKRIHVKADNRVCLPEKESRALFVLSFIHYVSDNAHETLTVFHGRIVNGV